VTGKKEVVTDLGREIKRAEAMAAEARRFLNTYFRPDSTACDALRNAVVALEKEASDLREAVRSSARKGRAN
jgi:hypothetical protein